MQVKRLIATGLPLLALVGGGLSLFLSEALRPGAPGEEVSILAASIASSIMYTGCAILFLLGLKNFTAKLKLAYAVFCVALILFALVELQLPIATLMGQSGNAWLSGVGVLVPILFAVGGMYAGVKLLASLYGVKGLWGRPWLVVILAIVAAVLGFMLPVGQVGTGGLEAAKGSNGLMAMLLVLFAACAGLLWHIKKMTTVTYTKAMLWFFVAMLSFVAITVITMGTVTLLGTAHPFMMSGGTVYAQAILALFLLKAAYEFNVLGGTTSAQQVQAPAGAPAQTNPMRIVDIIVAASQKVSNAGTIDPWLDRLRAITAGLEPGQPLSAHDRATLVGVYQKIEHYLAKEDPVRRYSESELRKLISRELQISDQVFLEEVSQPSATSGSSVISRGSSQ